MILQSERSAASRGEETTPSLGGGNGAVVRLEFKAMEMPRSTRLADLIAGHEPARAAPQVEKSATYEMQTQLEQRRFAEELEAARVAGRAAGREEAEMGCESRIAAERQKVLRLSTAFQQERDKYFAAVEAEVVKLALAIAARVLHREAKLDRMLLQAVVKVALEKVKEESGTVLRVPKEDVATWREMMRAEEVGTVEVSGDSRMERGECVLETRVGRVELGLSAQLEEIEKGFFDLLQQRPA